jgi:hypothetical protein
MTSEMPLMPTAISSEDPFSLEYRSQTIAVVRKEKWFDVPRPVAP